MVKMKEYPDKWFELAIVDPPYFADYGKEIYPGAAISTTGIARHRYESKHWDVPTQGYFDELQRISLHQIIWGYNYFNVRFMGSGRIIWDKQNDDSSFSKAEIAFCSLHKSVQMVRFMWNGMLQGDMLNKEARIHPTQKPVKLYEWLLKNYAKKGDKIVDTHGGSFSSAIACYNLDFDYVGMEIDADYFNAGKARSEQHMKQGRLFDNLISERRRIDADDDRGRS
jgi:site-specific DNA-methyltransferase (adenine-specific)